MSFSAYNITDVETLRNAVSEMKADIVLLKQENSMLKTELESEIKAVREPIRGVNSELSMELNELRELILTNVLSIERLCNEKSNETTLLLL